MQDEPAYFKFVTHYEGSRFLLGALKSKLEFFIRFFFTRTWAQILENLRHLLENTDVGLLRNLDN